MTDQPSTLYKVLGNPSVGLHQPIPKQMFVNVNV